jgi:hypothetical protein
MVPLPKDIKPTILYARNKSVDEENRVELEKLPGPERVFTHEDNEKELQHVLPKYSGNSVIFRCFVEKHLTVSREDSNQNGLTPCSFEINPQSRSASYAAEKSRCI